MTDPERPHPFTSAALHAANARLLALRTTFRQAEAQTDAVPAALSSSGAISRNDLPLPLPENRAEALAQFSHALQLVESHAYLAQCRLSFYTTGVCWKRLWVV